MTTDRPAPTRRHRPPQAAALAVDVPLRDGLSVRRLHTSDELDAVSAVSMAVFGRGGSLAAQVAARDIVVNESGAVDPLT